jgi:Protein of unknown function (DUF3551)
MRSSVTIAVACGAIALVAVAGEGAKTASAWGGSHCMSYREGRSDCSFTTLAQCQASASGTDARQMDSENAEGLMAAAVGYFAWGCFRYFC